MATIVPPKKNTAFITWVSLISRSSRPQFQSNPTLAVGDVKVSIDGGALANLATLPTVTPASGPIVKISLSADEMNGDVICVVFQDAAGTEWDDVALVIHTSTRSVDDLTFPNTSGRGIDVDASGGVEVGSFQAGAITAAAIATDAIDADALADSAITAATFAAGAIDAAAIAAGAVDADALAADAGTEIGVAVWASTTRSLTSFGTLIADVWSYVTRTLTSGAGASAADVWSYGTRTLTQSAASLTALLTGNAITDQRGDSWSIALTDLGALTGYTSLWITLKADRNNPDADALIQIKKNASGSGDGLLTVNGAAASDATKGSITINDAAGGDITIALDETITDDLTPGRYYYDIQVLTSGNVTTMTSNTFVIEPDVTRAVS